MTITLTLSAQQQVALERFREALAAPSEDLPKGLNLSMEDAAAVLFITACSAWMDADVIEGRPA